MEYGSPAKNQNKGYAKQERKDNKTKSGYFPDSKTLKGTN